MNLIACLYDTNMLSVFWGFFVFIFLKVAFIYCYIFSDCTKKTVDLVFLFDGSLSMTKEEFHENKVFITDIMKSLDNTSIKVTALLQHFSNHCICWSSIWILYIMLYKWFISSVFSVCSSAVLDGLQDGFWLQWLWKWSCYHQTDEWIPYVQSHQHTHGAQICAVSSVTCSMNCF